jgi:multiple antibiotic resistance protein
MRSALAWCIALNGFVLLLGSMFVGPRALALSGAESPVGWPCIVRLATAAGRGDSGQSKTVEAFYPLTMPLTVGPGSVAVAIALGAEQPLRVFDIARLAAGAFIGLAAIALTIFGRYLFAAADGLCARRAGSTG